MRKSGLLLLIFVLLLSQFGGLPAYAATETEGDFEYRDSDNGDGTVIITDYKGLGGDIVIPAQLGGKPVTEIDRTAFQEKELTKVKIPGSVKSIGVAAFAKNSELRSVTIENGVTLIGASAFTDGKLEEVTIPSSVTSIGKAAFYHNELRSVTIQSGVKSIDEGAFQYNKLEKVTIPSSVTSIGYFVFRGNPLKIVKFVGVPTGDVSSSFHIDGPDFKGWFEDAGFTKPVPGIVSTQIIYADWRYKVSFDTDGGTPVSAQPVVFNEEVIAPPAPTKENHTFAGWYKEAALTNGWNFTTDVVKQATTLYAKWTSNSYTLSFDTNGGSTVTNQNVVHNEKATAPAVPTKAGHTFAGWFIDSNFAIAWDFTTGVRADMTLYAKWDPVVPVSHTLTFEANGGTPEPIAQSIVQNEKAQEPTLPTKAGYTFAGWYYDDLTIKWDFDTDIVKANTTLYAQWTQNSSTIYYVKKSGADNNDGSSWTNAFSTLQAAFDKAVSGDQIWIAAGTYYPTKILGGFDPRSVTFQMKSGVEIYGGFPVSGEPVMTDRNFTTHPTILSGDFKQDDIPNDNTSNKDNNAYHVFHNEKVDAMAILDGVVITGGNSSYGGGMYNTESSPTLKNVTITGNIGQNGAGMFNSSSSPILINVTITGNQANGYGGGMYNTFNSSPELTNVTFSGNSANRNGGGMYNNGNSNPIINNSIFWGNSNEIYNDISDLTTLSKPKFSNSLIRGSGGSASWNADYGTNIEDNIDRDPLFVDEANGDYRIWTHSPAVFETYHLGALGIYGYKVTYDGNGSTSGLVPQDNSSYEQDEKFTVLDNEGSLVKAGHTFKGWSSTSADASVIDYVIGSEYLIRDENITLFAQWTKHLSTIYVKKNATGDGTSWANAFGTLQEALDEATTGDQIWIAEGTYTPTNLLDAGDSRSATFQMKNSVSIYGSFPNIGDPGMGERDFRTHQTILSGDLGTPGDSIDNAYSVFKNIGINATAVLDGVLITGGNGSSSGGMYNDNSHPTLTNVTISGNIGSYGGGMFNESSSPTLTNVTISENTASSDGGGMYNLSSNPTLTNVKISKNTALNDGGGIYNKYESPKLTDVELLGNTASDDGGGMYNRESHPVLKGVTISGNTAHDEGGGMYNNTSSNPTLTNVTFSGNTAIDAGGGMYNNFNSNPTINKSIFWGNSSEIYNDTSSPKFSNSLIQGSGGSGGWNLDYGIDQGDNTDGNPLFVDAISHTVAPTSAGDYRIWAHSPANFETYHKGSLGVHGYKVEFYDNGTTEVRGVDLNDLLLEPNPAPTKAGYTFAGWYEEADFTTKWSFATGVTKDMTLYAKWTKNSSGGGGGVIPTYTLTFESYGGSDVASQKLTYNGAAINPTAPTRTGYTFGGWYKEADFKTKWNFATDVVKENTTLYAKWTPNSSSGGGSGGGGYYTSYTLTFNANGSSTVADQNLSYNEKAVNPVAPTKAGYTFAGWYKEADFKTEWDFATDVIKENTVLYAKWNQNSYILTFATNEGSTIAAQTLGYNEKAVNPTVSTKTGYTFAGWYKEADFTTEWDFATDVVKENTTLYAKWSLNSSICTADFTDTATHWAQKEIDEIACLGIIKGYPDGTFKPNNSITREHVALMFTRAFELAPIRGPIEFTDVPKNHRYYDAITEVYRAGIFDGASDEKFNPNTHMTRAQMAKVLVLAFELQPSETSTNVFRDVSEAHWAKDYIATLADNGIALGDNGNFKPEESVTRAQFVAFMYRALNL